MVADDSQIPERVTRLEDRVDEHDRRLGTLDATVNSLRDAIKGTETLLLARIDKSDATVTGQLADMNKRYYETLLAQAQHIPSKYAYTAIVVFSALVGAFGFILGHHL